MGRFEAMRGLALAAALGLAVSAGCAEDLAIDSSGVTWLCSIDAHCGSGYTCVNQRCAPVSPPAADTAGGQDTAAPADTSSAPDTAGPDPTGGFDFTTECKDVSEEMCGDCCSGLGLDGSATGPEGCGCADSSNIACAGQTDAGGCNACCVDNGFTSGFFAFFCVCF